MLQSYFLSAFRNFWKHKAFSAINVLGLAIGISASLVIFLIVRYDFSFDKFEKDHARIYRVVSDFKFSGKEIKNPGVPAPLADAARTEVTGLSVVAPFHLPAFEMEVSIPNAKSAKPPTFKKQNAIAFVDSSYFNLLSYSWSSGSAARSVSSPYQVVLTEERLRQYFPTLPAAEAIGRQIVYNDSIQATVSGVVKNLAQRSDFGYKEFISLASISNTNLANNFDFSDWGSTNGTSQLLVKLSDGVPPENIERQLLPILTKNRKDQQQTSQDNYHLRLQPLNDVHFNSAYGIGWGENSGITVPGKPVLYSLALVALFLLLLGCVNFINLATAQAAQRGKEIGVRKTMGSSRSQLRIQFLVETFLITSLAGIISMTFVPFLLKIFQSFIPAGLNFNLLRNPGILFLLLGLIILITLLAGYYPSVILSRFNAVQVLKKQGTVSYGDGKSSAGLRKTLTVFQFIIAQVFIMGTLIVAKQIHYTLNKDLGFNKEAIVFFNTSSNDKYKNNRQVLLQKLKAIPGIQLSSVSNAPPSSSWWRSGKWTYMNGKTEIAAQVEMKLADSNYLKLFKLRLLAGTNISGDTVNNVIVNETYLHILGFQKPEDVLGQTLQWNGKTIPIVGVVADFHQSSLHDVIKPLLIAGRTSEMNSINLLLAPLNEASNNWTATIDKVKDVYQSLYPDEIFEYNFLDESIAKFYKKEQDVSRLLRWATVLAVLISCLGLLGLVIYTTTMRAKEIGVRKILGASAPQIIGILSKDFVALVVLAFAIAAPIAWWLTHKWLDNFSYKTSVNWWLFLLAGLLMIAIAIITLSFQTIKTALANPVKALRSE